MKRLISLILCLLTVALCAVSCGDEKEPVDATSAAGNTEHVFVEMSVKDFGVMKIELYPEYAPETVQNFVDLANRGFYDGLTFHRIMKGFMIQGGDPDGNGTGGSGKNIKGEFMSNGVYNSLSHTKGVISMARAQDPNSASSQFFIVNADGVSGSLDGQYAAFGMVVEGLDVLDKISDVDVVASSRGEMSVPVHTVYIDYVKVVD